MPILTFRPSGKPEQNSRSFNNDAALNLTASNSLTNRPWIRRYPEVT